MTAFAAIALDDGVLALTPGTEVEFSPSTIDQNSVAHLYSGETAGFDSRKHLSLAVKLPKVSGAVARVTGKLVIPVMDDANLKIGEVIGSFEFVMPKVAAQAERVLALNLLRAFTLDESVIAAVTNLESIY